jgi:hypothetical protein
VDQSWARIGRPNNSGASNFAFEDGRLCRPSVSKREKNLAIVSRRLIRDEENNIGPDL